jgi:hypothetical protein
MSSFAQELNQSTNTPHSFHHVDLARYL